MEPGFFSLPQGANPERDLPFGTDELGRPMYRTVLGETYAITPGQREQWSSKPGSWGRVKEMVTGAATDAVEGVKQGVTAPGRALAGEPMTYGDAAATAGMAQMGGVASMGPRALKYDPTTLAAIRAYHGSPHDFDKFSMDKIGTGEGAQAYGHGLYFAENEGVARSYRDALANRQYALGSVSSPLKSAWSLVGSGPDRVAMPTDDLLPYVKNAWPDVPDDEIRAAIDEAKGMFQPGRMYEVDIDANPEDFLDWDAPLAEQPTVLGRLGFAGMDEDAIHAEAARIMEAQPRGAWMNDPASKARIDELQDMLDRRPPSGTGQDYYRGGSDGDVSNILSQMGYGNPEAQTAALREAGIPGIRYRDAGSRGADGDSGTSNYVVFDDSLININRKYANASPALGVAAGTQTDDERKRELIEYLMSAGAMQ